MNRRPAFGMALVAAALAAGLAACSDREPAPSAKDLPVTPDLIARGHYLTQAADCAACHSVPGGKAFAGGYPFKLPFGTMYSSNITADRETGIGGWSDDDFVRALHQGVARNGQHLYPAFPYTSYTLMSRDDAVAIKAYLFSLPAVRAPQKPNDFPFPFNQRWGMMFWNAVFLKDHRFESKPDLSPRENRGAYLATALGHCAECHTPRNFAFGLETGQEFAGAVLQGWRAYNITSDRRFGVGAWTDQDLAAYLNAGHAEGHGSASGPMGEAVENSLQYLTPQDTAALVAYLRKVPARAGPPGTEISASPVAMAASYAWAPSRNEGPGGLGKRIFEGACASCHQWNGHGQQTPYAALAGDQAVNDPDGFNLTQAVLHGARLRAAGGAVFMPAFGSAYSDQEIAAVTNYVIGHFGGKTGRVTAAEIAKRRRD
jgi:mono/diheme cytochrome c family protein